MAYWQFFGTSYAGEVNPMQPVASESKNVISDKTDIPRFNADTATSSKCVLCLLNASLKFPKKKYGNNATIPLTNCINI